MFFVSSVSESQFPSTLSKNHFGDSLYQPLVKISRLNSKPPSASFEGELPPSSLKVSETSKSTSFLVPLCVQYEHFQCTVQSRYRRIQSLKIPGNTSLSSSQISTVSLLGKAYF
jgi:hypothetical protein